MRIVLSLILPYRSCRAGCIDLRLIGRPIKLQTFTYEIGVHGRNLNDGDRQDAVTRGTGMMKRGILALMLGMAGIAHARTGDVPHIATHDGHHALIVDGAPFLMLGAQVNNSSNYPAALPRVWPVLDRLHANTVEVPVAWQQVESQEGRFDFSFVQALLDGARAHGKRVVVLWFGAFKNTSPGYVPDWVKTDNRRFPRMKTRDGKDHYVLSPQARTTLDADKRAFVALMTYLRDHDPQNTVILAQVENETGSYQSPRDFGPAAQKLFDGPVPAALGKRGTWTQAYGGQADRAFNTWYTARYCGELAAAGKAVKPLPMYVNASLADPFKVPDPTGVASGGPQQDVLDIWKAAAPAIDYEAPDIYDRDPAHVMAYLDAYRRPDNALAVPEMGNAREYARFFWAAIGRGAIGFAPFGMDATGYGNYPLGAKVLDDATLDAFAAPYALFAPMASAWARVAFEHPTWGTAKGSDGAPQSTTMGDWTITASYGEWQFGHRTDTWIKSEPPAWADQPVGGAAVAQIAADQYLVSGDHVRLDFKPREGAPANGTVLRVEEGRLTDGGFVVDRVWNGDQTDYGLNFVDTPVLLRVTVGRYR
jgi:beta-galactosidase GanA